MKVLAINGSPRKNWNTAKLLNQALEGAGTQGAETELIHLYDYSFKGCVSCFACKLKGGNSYGQCGYKDGLTPILEKIDNADAVFLGSPIYFGSVTGGFHSFMERMLFRYLVYDEKGTSLCENKKPIGLILTMNVDKKTMELMGYDQIFQRYLSFLKRIYGSSELLIATNTYQFSDYSKYVNTKFNELEKAKWREEQFPVDCQKAYEMGVRFCQDKIR